MSGLVGHIAASTLLGAIIGAVAGLATSDFMLESAAGGTLIGASIGAYIGARISAHRFARQTSVRSFASSTHSRREQTVVEKVRATR